MNTTHDTSALVIEQITTYIQSCLSAWFGNGASLALAAPGLRRRKWSFFIRYLVNRPAAPPLGLLVKVPRLKQMASLADAAAAQELVPFTQIEYETLVQVSAAFEREGMHAFRAIRPVAFLARWNAIVMEELPSQPIKNLLSRPGMILGIEEDWRPLINALLNAGRWLRIFHTQIGRVEMQPLLDQHIGREIEETVTELEQENHGRADLEPTRQMLKSRLEHIGDIFVPVANLHTDMTCANIFVTPDGRVGVLDPGASVRAPVYKDLAVILNDVRTRFVQVMTNGRGYPAERLEECKRAVLQGYFGAAPFDEDVLALYSALAVIHKWAQDERELRETRGSRLVAPLVSPYLRGFFRSELMRYLSPVEAAISGGKLSAIG